MKEFIRDYGKTLLFFEVGSMFNFTFLFSAIILAVYILDTFILIPNTETVTSKEKWLTGHNKGCINHALRLSESKIKEGQIWRLVSSSLLHVGLVHILLNLVALLIVGCAVEQCIGSTKTAICFVGAVLVSGLFMSFVYKLQEGEGASTGIYGLIAVFVVLAIKKGTVLFSTVHPGFLIVLALYTVIGMLAGKATTCEHLSGFVGGLLMALIIMKSI